jgi:hypothetical protein
MCETVQALSDWTGGVFAVAGHAMIGHGGASAGELVRTPSDIPSRQRRHNGISALKA